MSNLTRTTKKPTKQGWWWYRETQTSAAHPVKVFGPKLFYVWPMDDRLNDNEMKDSRRVSRRIRRAVRPSDVALHSSSYADLSTLISWHALDRRTFV